MAVSVTCDLDLDLAKGQGARSDQVVHIRQGEAGCCTVRASVRSGQSQADLTGLTVELVGVNSRRELVEQAMASQSADVWQCTLKSEWGSRAGLCMAYVRASDGKGAVVTTDAFTISVAQCADMSEGEAAEYRRALDELMALLEKSEESAAGSASDASASARKAAALAAAAKSSEEAAAESAAEAKASAASAATSESDAQASKEAAGTSATGAAASASQASASAANAARSEGAAATSASSLAELDERYSESEQGRAEAEAARVQAERARAEAESSRSTAEAARASAEEGRASAERARADAVDGEVAKAAQANADAAKAAESATSAAEDARKAAAEARDAAPVPVYDEGTGRYDNESIAAWLARMRDGKNYGVSIPKGSATACTKTGANAGVANPVPGVIGRRAVDPYAGKGAFLFFEVNGGVDADGTPYVTAIDGDGRFSRKEDTWVMAPVLYTLETETDEAVNLTVSDTRQPGMARQPAAVLPSGAQRPYMLYAKYALSVDADGKPRSVSGAPVKTRTVSHDSGIGLMKTASTGDSLKAAADDWYVKAMFLLKYATKDSQSVFAGCTGYSVTASPTLAETDTTRVVVGKGEADLVVVGSAMMLGTHTGDSTDRWEPYNCDVFDGARVVGKAAVDDSNVALYFDVAKPFSTETTYWLATAPWNTGACDMVEGDGSPTSLTDGRQPFVIQGVELGLGIYEVLGNVLVQYTGDGSVVWVNPDTRNEKSGGMPDSALAAGAFPGPATEGWNHGLYPKTVHGLMMQRGTGASTSTGVCDGNYKSADTVVGWREWLSLGILGDGGNAGLWCVVGSGTGNTWWNIGSRRSANGRSRGESAA